VKLAYSYLRFSSPAQADGDSIRRQTALRDAWLKRREDVVLDTTFNMSDRGLSGYYGMHRKKGAMGKFLALVEARRIPSGSLLLVENIDRMGREAPKHALREIIFKLWDHNITIVTLAPEETYEPHCDSETKFIVLLILLQQAYERSRRASDMLGEAYAEKKVQARDGHLPHGAAVPAWIEIVGVRVLPNGKKDFSEARYRVKEDAGKTVRLIFKLSREGKGTLAIAARLNAEKVPTIARGKRWIRSYVAKILDNPAVLGTFQPMKGHHQRVKDGEPVEGYFPAVVKQKQWDEAHGAKEARNKRSGRPGKKGDFIYCFSGMLRCALDGCPLHVITRRGIRYVVSAEAVQGHAGSHWRQFPLEVLAGSLLGSLRELSGTELFSGPDASKVQELEGRLVQVEKRLGAALKHFEAEPEAEIWAAKVSQYDGEKRALIRELVEERRRTANPPAESWALAVKLMAAKEPERLRAALLTVVESVTCLFVPRDKVRIAACQVHFQGGSERSYLIVHHPAMSGAVGTHPARWSCRSLASVADAAELDLRRPEDAAALEVVLTELDLEKLTAEVE
jgi:DNA invertase Pin-like site-specific DNA recombinase